MSLSYRGSINPFTNYRHLPQWSCRIRRVLKLCRKLKDTPFSFLRDLQKISRLAELFTRHPFARRISPAHRGSVNAKITSRFVFSPFAAIYREKLCAICASRRKENYSFSSIANSGLKIERSLFRANVLLFSFKNAFSRHFRKSSGPSLLLRNGRTRVIAQSNQRWLSALCNPVTRSVRYRGCGCE